MLSPDEAHTFWNGTFSDAEKREIFHANGHGPVSLLFEWLPRDEVQIVGLNRYLLFDQLLYLPDDILALTDRMSMRHSLEVRGEDPPRVLGRELEESADHVLVSVPSLVVRHRVMIPSSRSTRRISQPSEYELKDGFSVRSILLIK